MNKDILILASQSTARIRLLKNAGLNFLSTSPEISEIKLQQEIAAQNPQEQAAILAKAKAYSLSNQFPHSYIIGCDQILSCNGKVIHKAISRIEAAKTLSELRANTHTLYSSLCIVKAGQEVFINTDNAKLTMRNFSNEFLENYLDVNLAHVISSVGCYHYEGPGIQLFDKVEGDTFTIQGIPLLPLLEFLRQNSIIKS